MFLVLCSLLASKNHQSAVDIDNQANDNYSYDLTGNLIRDVQEGIDSIKWTVYGKIRSIKKTNGSRIVYDYDASGNRVSKKEITGGNTISTWYVRDAQGNTMALYDTRDTTLKWKEQHLYGSSRLGMWQPRLALTSSTANKTWNREGQTQYELNNHLGNVLATVSDRKLQHTIDSTTISHYIADVLSAQDYYAFGMIQPGRSWQLGDNYRYGFNGKENDNDVKGKGNQQDYGMRIYDPRLGRFLSTDPLKAKYPYYTPYQFAGNNPIKYVDLDGLEPGTLQTLESPVIIIENSKSAAKWVLKTAIDVLGRATMVIDDIMMANNEHVSASQQKVHSKQAVDNLLILGFDAAAGYTAGRAFKFLGPVIRNIGKTEFSDGVTHLTTSARLANYAKSPTYGGDALFVAPKGQIDKLLNSGMTRSEIEFALGLESGALELGELIRIDIAPSAIKNLRQPLGTEATASRKFIPGGKTSGGVSEAVIDPVPKKSKGVIETVVKEKKKN